MMSLLYGIDDVDNRRVNENQLYICWSYQANILAILFILGLLFLTVLCIHAYEVMRLHLRLASYCRRKLGI
mgnify:CR=1 FL=1